MKNKKSMFKVKFIHYKNDFLFDYPFKNFGYRDLMKIRIDLKNPLIEYISPGEVKISTYILNVTTEQASELSVFQNKGFLICKVNPTSYLNLNKYLSFKYNFRNDDYSVEEIISVNDELLFSDWVKAGCPCEEQSVRKIMIM